MAQALGVSRSYYALMETGKRIVSEEFETQLSRLSPKSVVKSYGDMDGRDEAAVLNEPAAEYSVTPQYARKNLMSLFEKVDSGHDVVISVGSKRYRLTDCGESVSPSLDRWFDNPANIAKLTERIRSYEAGKDKTMSLEEARELWRNTK
ncbi:MAG: hypothetical protein MJY56_06640 [Bacteroidales bacterium]|nr:hypothetical protein [Bacteroidales bacterium]